MGFFLNDVTVNGIAEWPHTFGRASLFRTLFCARDWRADLRSISARATAALMRAYILPPSVLRFGVTIGGHQCQAMALGPVYPVLQLSRLARKTVEVVADDGAEPVGLVVRDHACVRGPDLGLVGSTDG